jgi:hypothetical protein
LKDKQSPILLFQDRRIQWSIACLFDILLVVFLYFLVTLTYTFRAKSNSQVGWFEVEYFFFFIAGSTILRTILKRTSLFFDQLKIGSISMFFIAEIIGVTYYYTFYRVLFNSIRSWSLFFFFPNGNAFIF